MGRVAGGRVVNPYRDHAYRSENLERMRAPWWRRALCRLGWHCPEAVWEMRLFAVNFDGERMRQWVRDGVLTYTRRLAVRLLCTACGRIRLVVIPNETGGLTAVRSSQWIGGGEASRILARCYR